MARNADQPRSHRTDGDAGTLDVSIIIPARNEERWLRATLDAAVAAVQHFLTDTAIPGRTAEIIVVDNDSTDATWDISQHYADRHGVFPIRLDVLGAARARNRGRESARGRVLVFVDADTLIPADGISRIWEHFVRRGKQAGITALAALDGGWWACCWWTFWGQVRRLPLPRAKAMPALMFCTAQVFDELGPFDEEVAIGEEWPILAALYRKRPAQFIYDRSLVARTSSRRMERQAFGYLKTFLKYVWAILDRKGRVHYSDHIR
jgi:glycosyltransferase involved in cell wall biosynthesis